MNIPHNWDDYYGYRQLTHGNLHGTAMYIKDFILDKFQFSTPDSRLLRRYFLRFEGVGTYATIKVNGHDFGRYPVGRTTLTLDVTDALKQGTNRPGSKSRASGNDSRYAVGMWWLFVGMGIQRRISAVRYIPSGGTGGNRRDPY